jgi:cytoskeletal protein CcmA (bactofilin family)
MINSKNILAKDVEIKGSVKISDGLIIDGKIEGEVISDGSLTIGENALINGEVKTRSLVIYGKVEGNITVQERCEIKNIAILVGDLAAGTLAIQEGATFMGKSRVGKNAVSKPALNTGATSMDGGALAGDTKAQPQSSVLTALLLEVKQPTPQEH